MLDLHLTVRGVVEYDPVNAVVSCDSANVELEGENIGALVRNTLNNDLAIMDWLDSVEGHTFLIDYLLQLPDDHLQTLVHENEELKRALLGALNHVTHR